MGRGQVSMINDIIQTAANHVLNLLAVIFNTCARAA